MAEAGHFAWCRLPSIIRRGESVPGTWVAECVPLDIMTQGDSLEHAMAMLVDAVDLVIDDYLGRGIDPLAVCRPSPESAEELRWLLAGPLMAVDIMDVDESVTLVLALVDVRRPVVPAMGSGRPAPKSERPVERRYEPLGAARKPVSRPATV